MTITLKKASIENHYICLEQDKTGIITVSDYISYGGDYRTNKQMTYAACELKKATATFNRYKKAVSAN